MFRDLSHVVFYTCFALCFLCFALSDWKFLRKVDYMKLKFWGVRGSIPSPGPHTVKYGGNTICIEILFQDLHRRIIVDAGSGIRQLGNHLMRDKSNGNPVKADIF